MSGEILIFVLVGLNVIVFLLPMLVKFGDGFMRSRDYFMTLTWKDNRAIRNGEFYRLVTSNFVHADGMHLFFNMYALFAVGGSVLAVFGPLLFILIYLLSGISGSLFSYFFNSRPSVGASGAIFGLVGALLAISILSGNLSSIGSLVFIVAINFFLGMASRRIDNWGHLGGLVGGFVIAMILAFLPI